MNIKSITTLVALLWIVEANAQTPVSHHSLTDSLYWVVETNLRSRSFSIVRIYNRQNIKVYEVRLQGEYLDPRKPKHRRRLDSMIKQVSELVAAPAGKQTSKTL